MLPNFDYGKHMGKYRGVTEVEAAMVDFLYDPMTRRCVAWTLNGDVFADDDRKIATTDRTGNVYALDGELVGHLDATGVVPAETGVPNAFAKLLTKAARN